ncbi:MAG: hypothetical protein E6K79_00500 [Candidatus Eisenbacteria bacterium]|uniref:Uncharacterized protein n=1 Tax=Eiseniibacteriota bacterium TaxID=2212470 RepID=A0A538TUF1_UNCEI|nr:MAG: hypothetical protein E6K79_00500 [Candidatus Eisenbacteria bacterium]
MRRTFWVCAVVIGLHLATSAAVARAGHSPPMTHGMALDSVAAIVAQDLLQGVSIPPGRPVVLRSPAPGDTLGLLTKQLVDRLRAQNVTVRFPAASAAAGDSSVAAATSADGPLHLDLQVDGSGVSYVRRVGSFPFGTRGYERLAAMRANATLLDPANGEVLWTRSATRAATDLVPKSEVVYAASGSGPLNPQVPRGGGTRWLEPMIVVGVVAGLVVLFYSNRN